MTNNDDKTWNPGVELPTKKGTYSVRLNAPGANPPYVEIDAEWNGKKWREDGQFDIPADAVLSWK